MKSGLLPADDPAEIGLEHGRRLVDVLAGQVHAGFQAQRVARAQADGHDPGRRACFENRIPHALRGCGRDEQLEPVFTGVPRAGDDAANAGDFAVGEPVVLHRGEIGSRQLLNDRGRRRSLNGQQRVSRARVDDGDVANRARLRRRSTCTPSRCSPAFTTSRK